MKNNKKNKKNEKKEKKTKKTQQKKILWKRIKKQRRIEYNIKDKLKRK